MHPHEPPAPLDVSASRGGPGRLDNAYVLGHHGFVYSSHGLPTGTTVRHPAAVLISVHEAPFQLTLSDGRCLVTHAALVPPRVERVLAAEAVAMLSFNVMPAHPSYHVFRAAQPGGVVSVDRHLFNPLHAEFDALLRGQADLADAERVFAKVVVAMLRVLPPHRLPTRRRCR